MYIYFSWTLYLSPLTLFMLVVKCIYVWLSNCLPLILFYCICTWLLGINITEWFNKEWKGLSSRHTLLQFSPVKWLLSDREIRSSDWLVVCFVGHVPVGGNGTPRRWTNGHLQTTPESVQSHQHDFPSCKLLCNLNADMCVFLVFLSMHLCIHFRMYITQTTSFSYTCWMLQYLQV